MSAAVAHDHWVELAERAGDGLQVTLWWSRATDGVKVTVDRVHSGARAELHVAPDRALDAFYHPFVYAESPRATATLVGAAEGS